MGVRIDGSNDVISAADGSLTVDGLSLSVTGIITASGGFKVGSAYTAFSNGNVETTGIITTSGGLNVTGGNLGIGTAIPGAKTHINSGSNNTPLIVEASETNRSRVVFRNNTETGTECNIELFDDDLRFVTNSGERVRITSGGDVGIGTEAPETPRGNRGLEVAGTTGAEIVATRYDDNLVDGDFIGGFVFKNLDAGGTPNHFAGMYAKANGTAGSMDLHFSSDRAQYEADTSDLIIRSGNVGINTTDPTSVFDVQVNTLAGINFTNTGQSPLLDFRANNVETAGRIRVAENGGGAEMLFFTKTTGGTITESFRVDTSQRVLIGTTSNVGSSSVLQVREDGFGRNLEIFRSYDGANTPARIRFSNSRGTAASPTIVVDGDDLGEIRFNGHDGTNYDTPAAAIFGTVDGTPGENDMPGRLEFHTTADSGSSTTERLRITSGGFFNFNSANNNNLQGRVTIFDGGNFSTSSTLGSGDSDNIYLISDATSGDGVYGASIAFSRVQYQDRRAAAIASVQTTSDEDQVGLAFFTHPSTDASAALVEAMRVDHAGRLLIGSTQRTVGGINCALHVEGTGADDSSITLVRNTNGATNPPYLMLGKSRSGSLGGDTIVQNGDLLGYISFNAADGNDLDGGAAAIQAAIDGTPGSNDVPGRLEFMTTADGNNSSSARMVINRNGELRMGYGNSDPVSTDQVHSFGDPSLDTVTTNLARLVMQEKSGNWISFKDGGGTHYGTISRSGSNVVYGGQSSDYRIKENVVGVSTGIDTLKRLRPVHFNYTSDSGFTAEEQAVNRIGFIAHEYAEVCPDGVIGEKDGYDILGNCVNDTTGKNTQHLVYESQAKDGETWTETSREPKYQQIDFSKAVPVLTAALQEAITKIETLEAKVAVLEGG